jgi:hypothetical protein
MALGPLSVVSSGGISIETLARTQQRKLRKPSHTFQVRMKPYSIVPTLIAPVLPGETLKNLLLQARAVSDPVVSPLVGWWHEHYFFYVKLRDLAERDQMTEMLLTGAAPVAGAGYAAAGYYKQSTGGYDFLGSAVTRIIQEYFRDDEENLAGSIGDYVNSTDQNYRKAKINLENALQSLMLDSDLPVAEDEQLLGEGYTLPPHLVQFQTQYDAFVKMRDMTLTDATFEDWLKQHGVRVDQAIREEQHRPELLRYVREWTYPSNTIDPVTGTPSSALSWSIAERADKDRYFAEPGFVVGVTCTRPKVYLSKQQNYMAAHFNDAYAWLPAILDANPFTSLKKFVAAVPDLGPVKDLAGDYWIDLKDLLLHGDQFINFAAPKSLVALPDDSVIDADLPLNRSYAANADITALFKTAGSEFINIDGRIDLSILSRVSETTP